MPISLQCLWQRAAVGSVAGRVRSVCAQWPLLPMALFGSAMIATGAQADAPAMPQALPSPRPSVTADCSGALCNTDALASFFAALEQSGSRRVHILQIGDSHTAGDLITNGWRVPMQARFGNGGRGVLAAGRPYRNFLSFGVTVAADTAWDTNGTFGNNWQEYGPSVGLTSYTHTARRAGAWLSLTADTPQDNFSSAMICGLTGPQMGAVSVQFGGRQFEVDFNQPGDKARCFRLDSPLPTETVTLLTRDDRPVSLTSFGALNSSGVLVSNLGVSGSQLLHFARTDDVILQHELAAYQPDLIVFAFGTNEGFAGKKDLGEYRALLANQLRRIRALSGRQVPVLLIGPPDALTVRPNVAYGSLTPPVSCTDRLMTPGLLLDVRAIQQQVARSEGVAYWDWLGAMGGICSAMQWRANGDMASDYVHFTKAGSLRIGTMLANDMDNARISYNLNR